MYSVGNERQLDGERILFLPFEQRARGPAYRTVGIVEALARYELLCHVCLLQIPLVKVCFTNQQR